MFVGVLVFLISKFLYIFKFLKFEIFIFFKIMICSHDY